MRRLSSLSAFAVMALAFSTQAGARQLGNPASVSISSYADDARQPDHESRRAAYHNGYREGVKEGEHDGRGGRAHRYEDNRTWQHADKGYNRSFGDFDRYRQQFRIGFGEGYQSAYNRFAPAYGRAVPRPDSYGYPGYPNQGREPYYAQEGSYQGARYGYSAAYPNGMSDGMKKGREDAEKRRSYDPLRHSWYRSADDDYRKEYGSKQQYEDVYRRGFKEGYEKAYRDFGYYR